MEREVIGFLITKNPLAQFKTIIDQKTNKKLGDIQEADSGKTYIVAGVISGRKIIKTKKDSLEMAIVNLFDETGSFEVVFFPKTYAKLKDILSINKVIMLKGKVTDRDGRLGAIVENAVGLNSNVKS